MNRDGPLTRIVALVAESTGSYCFAKSARRLLDGLNLLQPVLDCDDGCLSTVRDAKFRQNSADMISHRPIG